MEYYYEFNHEKNKKLLEERGIGFEQIISLIEQGFVIDTIEHYNQDKYTNQKIYVVDVDNYCYLVPHVIKDKEIFLKTIIPSRKVTRDYMLKFNTNNNANGGKNEKNTITSRRTADIR